MTRIAVACQGNNLDDPVDLYFGLAPYFLIVDPETMDHQVFDNLVYACQGCGLSDEILEFLARHGVDSILTGFMDPNEFEVIHDAGMRIGVGWEGFSALEVVEQYKQGFFEAVDERYYLA